MSSRWMSKPPVGSVIDWGNPLAKGLVGAWLMNEGGGNVVKNLAQSKDVSMFGSIPSVITSRGIGRQFSGTANTGLMQYPDKIFPSGNLPLSILVLANPISETTARCFVSLRSASGKGQFRFEANRNGTVAAQDYLTFITYDSTLTESYASLSYTIDGGFHQFGAVRYPNTNMAIYVDGISKYNNAKALRDFFDPASPGFNIGSVCTGSTTQVVNFNRKMIYVYVWYGRALSPSEIQSLYESPYQFIKGPSTITYFTAPAGGWTWGGEVKNVMVA